MPHTMETDVGLFQVAGGQSLATPPAGTLALVAPRRAARGRDHDFFFVSVNIPGQNGGLEARLAQEAARTFFGTPGSVTSALRAAANQLNQDLTERQLIATLTAAALRHRSLYIIQCGPSQAALVRPGAVTPMSADESASRPLGTSMAPLIQFRHLEVQPQDLIVLSPSDADTWTELELSGLAGLDLPLAIERLTTVSRRDASGLILRVPNGKPSAASEPKQQKLSFIRRRSESNGAEPSEHQVDPAPMPETKSVPVVESVMATSGSVINQLRNRVWLLVQRLAPGLPDPNKLSPSILAVTAAAVPVLVVGVSSIVYFKSGRGEQFESYMAQARGAIVTAQMAEDAGAAYVDWVLASEWLQLAEKYQQTEESQALREQVQYQLDSHDLVVRLDFLPAVSGGFGPRADLALVAATATDLYAYDRGTETIWHAWSTGRGFEIDSQFDCLAGRNSIPDFGPPVGLAIQPEPGALGSEGVVGVDGDGTLLYCAPGEQPLSSQLTTPDVGWGLIQAIDVFGNDLYVLDPAKNAVWIYDAADGLFSGSPGLYFVEHVPELGSAVDLALAQDELIILYAEGEIDRCRRTIENTLQGTLRIQVECEEDTAFTDERPGQTPQLSLPQVSSVEYSPPPEPSLFFMDPDSGTVYHYSMRLVYQGRYPTQVGEPVAAITDGPPNDLYLAAGDQIYYAQLGR